MRHNLTTEPHRDADRYEYRLGRTPASGPETDTARQIGYTFEDYAFASASPLLVPEQRPCPVTILHVIFDHPSPSGLSCSDLAIL